MKIKPIWGLALLSLLAGCVRNPGDAMQPKTHSGPVKVKSEQRLIDADGNEGKRIVPIRRLQGTDYVSLPAIARAAGFSGQWLRNGAYGVGDHDPVWEFRTGESAVSIAGSAWRMPAPAVREGEELFIPRTALSKLFGNETAYREETERISFFPKPPRSDSGASGGAGDAEDAGADRHDGQPSRADGGTAKRPGVTASSLADADSLLAFAKKFLGVKYEFGAGSYEQTGKFDCSSYTQHVFKPFGIDLPRVARAQAEKGTFVARDELKAGDLLFFYVPGRFKDNKTVGHVGIYMGDGNMIHASPTPEDGVQITPIDRAHWKETYLFSRRYG
ncbi:C40 family peptidase [Paenibacillaceae bacterium WGS1546]|uniref:C40 family peptidase n=1 Tax=Cohnella sp. WGS1546 TaxID=3366810 RepID=UPI00372D3879